MIVYCVSLLSSARYILQRERDYKNTKFYGIMLKKMEKKKTKRETRKEKLDWPMRTRETPGNLRRNRSSSLTYNFGRSEFGGEPSVITELTPAQPAPSKVLRKTADGRDERGLAALAAAGDNRVRLLFGSTRGGVARDAVPERARQQPSSPVDGLHRALFSWALRSETISARPASVVPRSTASSNLFTRVGLLYLARMSRDNVFTTVLMSFFVPSIRSIKCYGQTRPRNRKKRNLSATIPPLIAPPPN